MKKIIALFITFILLSSNASFAFSELYYLKNTTESAIKPIVESNYSDRNYKIIKYNPYYAQSQKNAQDYAVIILQQSGSNLFYYYQANDDKRLNKNILKEIKKRDIEYEQSYNTNIINIYDELARKAMNTQTTQNYIFTEPIPQNNVRTTDGYTQTVQRQTPNTLKGYVAQLATGTKINVYLQSSINTASAVEGDRIVAVLTSNVNYNGITVFPQGSVVYGILTKARHATYGSRNGRVVIDFNQIVTPDNKTYNISTEKIDFTVTNEGKVGRVASNVAVGAIVGGLTGLLVGALSGNIGSAAAIGAGIGAGGALIGGTAERGVDAEIPSFTEMELELTSPVSVTVNY